MWAVWWRFREQRELCRLYPTGSGNLKQVQAAPGKGCKRSIITGHHVEPCDGVVGPKKALGRGLLNSSYIATCVKEKYRFLYEILSSECHGNAGTHWLTDGGSAEGLCLARAGYFWAPSSLWPTPEPFFWSTQCFMALWPVIWRETAKGCYFFLLTSLIHTMLCHSDIPFKLGDCPID